MKTTTALLATMALLLPPAAFAAQFDLPAGASLVAEERDAMTSQRLAIGPYDGRSLPSIWAEGARVQQVWQTPQTGLTTLQFLAPLRDQLAAEGYEILFECRDADCGGFDFRYAQEILPEPDMHVNLGDFRFLAAQRMTDGQPEYVMLVVSRNKTRGFLQVTSIGAAEDEPFLPVTTSTRNMPEAIVDMAAETDLGETLEKTGVAVLEDLEFETGSSNLTLGDFPTLGELAAYLHDRPDMRVTLVGHTDAVGSMEANFRLSKARAQSVRDRLILDFGVDASQIDAQGVGYLSPLASNLSEDGRQANRRVEVVLTTTN